MEHLDLLHVDLAEEFISQNFLTETLRSGYHSVEIQPVNILVAQSVDAAPYHQYQDQNPGQKSQVKKALKRMKPRVLPDSAERELTTKTG
jgi:hypothetical protein